MPRPTIKQKLAFRELLKRIESGKSINWKQIMLSANYSEATAINPGKNLLDKEGFKQLLAQIDDRVILARIYEILITSDKDASLKAADMLLKLKDHFPAKKSKVITLFDRIRDLTDPQDQPTEFPALPDKNKKKR